jgi:sulfur-oxidizing protein SoxA
MLKKITIIAAGLALCLGAAATVNAGVVQDDIEHFQHYYVKKFPNVVPKEDFVNGVYAIDPIGRENWEAIEEFPPYELFVDEGEEMWNTPFANGKGYQECFPDGPAQRKNYPHWDKERKMVVTLPLAINECREANGEKPLKFCLFACTGAVERQAVAHGGEEELQVAVLLALGLERLGPHLLVATGETAVQGA